MDTSTLSFSNDVPDAPHTMSSFKQTPEPSAWHTRLMAPLTKQFGSAKAAKAMARHTTAAAASAAGVAAASSMHIKTYAMYEAPGLPQPPYEGGDGPSTILIVFIPILVVILTVLLGVLVFLIALLCMRRGKGIRLTEDGGPLDLSRGDGVIGEGGVEGVESRWLETVDPDVAAAYRRAKDWQMQYPPSSVPTDITLSQFLSIQEKGVSAWAFEPDYEENLSLYVQSRTEITFLADGPGMAVREGGGNSVMANLPLPKLNEVYYWEVKMYEKPVTTEVAIGLATKPYPSFRLPGWNRFSVAYFASDGFKSHNFPFTASSYGPPLAEGDVLGVGYRPRTGTVFFTRNGRKLEDCYTGLNKLNLFPTVGANGPCTLHVNLGQAGFVFIEANVKKWGLAPMVGTLAPPPAYGSERGSILLDAGYGTPGASGAQNLGGIGALLEAARARAQGAGGARPNPIAVAGPSSPPATPRPARRHRNPNTSGSVPAVPSPLRDGQSIASRRRQIAEAVASSYRSPTDTPLVAPRVPAVDEIESESGMDDDVDDEASDASWQSPPNPPTPNLLDISMHSLRGEQSYFNRWPRRRAADRDGDESEDASTAGPGGAPSTTSNESGSTVRPAMQREPSLGPPEDSPPPPGYAPLDPHVYSQGLPADLPEDLINQAIAAMSDS